MTGPPGCSGPSESRIGTVRYVRIVSHYNATLPRPDGKTPDLFIVQAYTQQMPQLILFEWGVHLIDTLRMLFGEVDWVHSYMDKASPLCAGEDRAFLTLGYGGVMANIDISWASIVSEHLPSVLDDVIIEGDEGTIALMPNQGQGDMIRITDWRGTPLIRPGEKRVGSPYRVIVRPAHDGMARALEGVEAAEAARAEGLLEGVYETAPAHLREQDEELRHRLRQGGRGTG